MRLVITGADGYIGEGVIRALLDSGNEVHGFGLGSAPAVDSCGAFSYTRGDVFGLGSQNIADLSPDAVIHLAWRNGFRHGDVSHVDDLPLHYKFIRDCVAAGVPRLAVMGSMHEVGYHEGAVAADTSCNPTTPYAIAKNALRQLAVGECSESGTSLLWMMGFYIVSADGRGDSIFSKIVAAAREGRKTFPFTSGKNKYDFLDYGDFCAEVAGLVLDQNCRGVVNVCSGRPESLASRVERFIKDNGFDIQLDYGAFPDRSYDSPAIWGERMKSREVDVHEPFNS